MSSPGVYRAEPAGPAGPAGLGTSKAPGSPRDPLAWANTHRAEAGGILIAAVAGILYWRSRSAASSTAAASNGATTSTTGTTDTAGLVAPDTETSDIENWVQDALNSEQASVDAQLSASSPPAAPTPTTPAPPPTTTNSNTYAVRTVPGGFVIPGSFNSNQSLRSIATALTPAAKRGNPNAVQETLLQLVAANPGLKGKTTAQGGHVLKMPGAVG